jgi:arginyl-tRNA synthetase
MIGCLVILLDAKSLEQDPTQHLYQVYNPVGLIAQFPDVIQQTLESHEPATVLTCLFRLMHVINSGYEGLKVMGRAGSPKGSIGAILRSPDRFDNGIRL